MSKKTLALCLVALLAVSSVASAQSVTPISQLPSATGPLAGSEMIPCVQGGVTKKCLESQTGSNLLGVTIVPGGTITPSTVGGIVGTTAGDSAQAGSDGEYQSSSFVGTAVTSSAANITTISLTAGDWDVSAATTFNAAGGNIVGCIAGVSTTSLVYGPAGTYNQISAASAAGLTIWTATTQGIRVNVSTNTTVYLVSNCSVSAGTVAASGVVRARRVR